jgi:hypothetical protein
MGQGVSVLVVFARKPFVMVFAGDNGAFLRSLGLVGQHMGFEILEDLAAVGMRASTFLGALLTWL